MKVSNESILHVYIYCPSLVLKTNEAHIAEKGSVLIAIDTDSVAQE